MSLDRPNARTVLAILAVAAAATVATAQVRPTPNARGQAESVDRALPPLYTAELEGVTVMLDAGGGIRWDRDTAPRPWSDQELRTAELLQRTAETVYHRRYAQPREGDYEVIRSEIWSCHRADWAELYTFGWEPVTPVDCYTMELWVQLLPGGEWVRWAAVPAERGQLTIGAFADREADFPVWEGELEDHRLVLRNGHGAEVWFPEEQAITIDD